MEKLLSELETLKISGDFTHTDLWTQATKLFERTFVPRILRGTDRPCEEKDYREYRQVIDRNLKNIESTLREILSTCDEFNVSDILMNEDVRTFVTNAIIVIGEQNEKNIWNTINSVAMANNIKSLICRLCSRDCISTTLVELKCRNSNSNTEEIVLDQILASLRPKLMKDTWKTYPAAISCYKWILHQVREPELSSRINNIIPTALIILDDHIVENRLLGLECLGLILKHIHMREELIDTGYADVIYDVLKRLTLLHETSFIIPVYSCLASVLSTTEYYNRTNSFEWTRRDDVLMSLLGNMEYEQDLDKRRAYMSSLPSLLTNIGCVKWCKRLSRILSEYCEYHADLKTLMDTLNVAELFLTTFAKRIPSHCTILYTAFLKLHMDLIDSSNCDQEVVTKVENILALLYKLTPEIGTKIMCDDRVATVIDKHLRNRLCGGTV